MTDAELVPVLVEWSEDGGTTWSFYEEMSRYDWEEFFDGRDDPEYAMFRRLDR